MIDEQHETDELKPTVGEVLFGGLLLVAIGPNPAAWPLVPLVALAGGAAFLGRRTPELREAVEGWLDNERLPPQLEGVVRRLPVPPCETGLVVHRHAPVRRPQRNIIDAEPTGRGPLGEGGLRGLFGDDQPTRSTNTGTRASGTRPTKRLVAPPTECIDPDAAWLQEKTQTKALPAPQPATPLAIRALCTLLNENVDDRPHILIVGPSGSGKTALAQLLIGTRPGQVVILDPKRPKGWEPPKWGGLPYVSRDSDGGYLAMVAALTAVVNEMVRRYQAQETATSPFPQLTVILDEAKNAVEECRELAELYRKIVSIGREVSIRLVLLSTTDRAGKLGFDGEADSMDSLAWVRLGQFAVNVYSDARQLGDAAYHWAVFEEAGVWRPFANAKTYGLVQRLQLPKTKAWSGVKANCQTGQTGAHQAAVLPSSAGAPVSVAAQRLPVASQQRAARPAVTDPLLEALLLAETSAETRKLSTFSGAETTVETLETEVETAETETLRKQFPARSNAIPGSFRSFQTDTQIAEILVKTASPDEKRKLGNSWKLLTVNRLPWKEAVLQGFACTPGRAYQRGSRLLRALKTLDEAGLLVR